MREFHDIKDEILLVSLRDQSGVSQVIGNILPYT